MRIDLYDRRFRIDEYNQITAKCHVWIDELDFGNNEIVTTLRLMLQDEEKVLHQFVDRDSSRMRARRIVQAECFFSANYELVRNANNLPVDESEVTYEA